MEALGELAYQLMLPLPLVVETLRQYRDYTPTGDDSSDDEAP